MIPWTPRWKNIWDTKCSLAVKSTDVSEKERITRENSVENPYCNKNEEQMYDLCACNVIDMIF